MLLAQSTAKTIPWTPEGSPEGRAYLQGRQVSAIRLEYADGWWWNTLNVKRFFQPEIKVSFYGLTVPVRPLPDDAGQTQWESLHALMRYRLGNGISPRIEVLPSGQPAVVLTRNAEVTITADKPCSSLAVEAHPQTTLPVRFYVTFRRPEEAVSRRLVELHARSGSIPLSIPANKYADLFAAGVSLASDGKIFILGCN